MRVAIGTFARSAIEARLGPDLPAAVRAALFHYTRRLKSGWKPVSFPRFRHESLLDGAGPQLELSVDPEIERILEREVARQGAPVDLLAAHAVFVYLADLDTICGPAVDSTPAVH